MPQKSETPQIYQSKYITPVTELSPPDRIAEITTSRRPSFWEKLKQKA